MLAVSTQVRGFKPGRSRRIFKGEKILSTPSSRGEVKPSVPCRRFAACKRSLNGVEVIISHVMADMEAPGGEKLEHLKSGGKQWQATPKNLPRIQRQSHTSRLTELWSLPRPAQGLNTLQNPSSLTHKLN